MESSSARVTGKNKHVILSPDVFTLAGVFVMVFIMGLVKIYSPDLGFHLKSAEWIIHNKKFIHTDSFNYVAAGSNYYDMQWVFQLIIYGLSRAGGDSALVIANSLLILFSLILVWIRFSKSIKLPFTNIQHGVFALLALVFVQGLTFEIRPHVFSWIFLNLILLSLESSKRGNQKALFFLPVIMLAWANTHSLSVLGLATIAIYNVGSWLETKKLEKKLLIFSALSCVAFFITPYFIGGLFYALSQFGLISGKSLLKTYIGELQSPFSIEEIKKLGSGYFTSPLLVVHIAAVLSLFSIRRSIIQKQYTETLLLAAYLVILYMAIKNYGYFLMTCLPIIAKYTLAWLERRKKNYTVNKAVTGKKSKTARENVRNSEMEPGRKLYKRLSIAVIIIAIFISITSITDSYALFRHSPYRFGFTTDTDQLPVQATNFLKRNNIKGKILNHLDFGGYLMAHYDEKVFIDGRMDVLPENFFEKYYQSIVQVNGIKKLLDEYNPDVVVFPYVKAANWWAYFISHRGQSGYKAVYFDGLSVIYLKSSSFPQVDEVNQKNLLLTVDKYAYTHLDALVKEEKPGSVAILFKGLWQKQAFSIADQNMATYCFTNSFDTAAISFSVKGIESSTVPTPAIYKNLAIYYREKKIFQAAQLCEEKAD